MAVCIEALPRKQRKIFQASRYPLGGPQYYGVLPHGAVGCKGGSRNCHQGGPDNFLKHCTEGGVRTCLEKQLDPRGPIASRETIGPERSNCFSRVSVSVFLREHIVTWDFPEVYGPVSPLWIRLWLDCGM